MKRIQHYATYLKGGAGSAAKRIFDGIHAETAKTGSCYQDRWELEFLCRADQELSEPHTSHFQPSASFFDRAVPRRMNRKSFKMAAAHYHSHLRDRPKEYECFSPARLYEPTAIGNTKNIDLIHLHWIAFLFDYITFFRSVPRSIPWVWTLHDMNAFTGGCHYSAGCNSYMKGCGNCFQIANPGSTDLSVVTLKNKKKAFSNKNMTVVSPCQWLTKLAQGSSVFPAQTRFETIHYGLDTKRYFPMEKAVAKKKLGFSDDRTTLVFGAVDLGIPRKGIEPLIKALHLVPDPDRYRCLVFGGGEFRDSNFKSLKQKMEVRNLGFLKTVEEKRVVYSAGDIFLLPSLEDNQPQTGLESLSCGTPVVGFDAGGIPEFVKHGTTGLLATVDDAGSLAEQVSWLSRNSDLRVEFGMNGRDLVQEQFEVEEQTRKYLQLYDEILGQNHSWRCDAS